MFAVFEDGSHQYRVQPGATLTVDYRADAKNGDSIAFDRVLLANAGGASSIGQPTIDGAAVVGEVISSLVKGQKLEIQKFRRRKNSRRHTGHRQKFTSILITKINVPGLEVVEPHELQASTGSEEPKIATTEDDVSDDIEYSSTDQNSQKED